MITIKLTNSHIFEAATLLLKYFNTERKEKLYLPVKVSFYLCKNISLLRTLASEIEEQQQNILRRFGTVDENGQLKFSKEDENIINKEFTDLMNLEQEVTIYQISLNTLEALELSMAQIEALMFMIKEVEE